MSEGKPSSGAPKSDTAPVKDQGSASTPFSSAEPRLCEPGAVPQGLHPDGATLPGMHKKLFSVRSLNSQVWYQDGKALMDKVPEFRKAARKYGELCQATYSAYLCLPPDADPTAPVPSLPVENEDKVKPSKKEWHASIALPMEQLLGPHSTRDAPVFGADNGYNEPDNVILQYDFVVNEYLYAAAGVTDRGSARGYTGNKKWIGFVAYSKALQEVVVVFRGTIDPDEWAQNADFRSRPVKDNIPHSNLPAEVRAHNGFMECYYVEAKKGGKSIMEKPLWQQVMDAIAEAAGEAAKQGWQPRVLTITGHSLGGALSTVAAFDIRHRLELPEERWDDTLKSLKTLWPDLHECIRGVTFAQPMVGNKQYMELFNKKIGQDKWIRLTNQGDVVPQIPYATIGWVTSAADKFFFGRLSGQSSGLQQAASASSLPAPEGAISTGELIGQAHANRDKRDMYWHVGWELRFFPDNYAYLDVTNFSGIARYATYVPMTLWRSFWQVTYRPILGLMAGQPFFWRLDNLPEPIIYEKAIVRHGMELYLHLVDPSLDKVRLNKTADLLRSSALSPEERERLNGKVSWWNQWNPWSPPAEIEETHSGMVLYKDPFSAKYLWSHKSAILHTGNSTQLPATGSQLLAAAGYVGLANQS